MIIGDNMNKKDLWNLFKQTGKIEYYLDYKNKRKQRKHDQKSRRHSYKRNRL